MTFILLCYAQLLVASVVPMFKKFRSDSLDHLQSVTLDVFDSHRNEWLSSLDRKMLAWGSFSLDPEYPRLVDELMRAGGFASLKDAVQDLFKHNASVLSILSEFLESCNIFASLQVFVGPQRNWIRDTLKSTVTAYAPGLGKCLFKILPNGLRSHYDTMFTHIAGFHLEKSALFPLGSFPTDGTWVEDEAHSTLTRRLRMVFSFSGDRRFLDLQEGCAAELAPDVNLRIIPELRMAIQYDSFRLVLWREASNTPEVLMECDEDVAILHLSYSSVSGLVYLRAGVDKNVASFIIPGNSDGPVHHLTRRPFIWVDGDILDYRFWDEKPLFLGAERASRYPSRPVIEDLRIVQVGDVLAVVDVTKVRLQKLFDFECSRLHGFNGERGILFSDICSTGRFDLIEKFIHGRPYADLDLIEMISNL